MYSPFWPDEKLPEEANSICDETLARWPSEHNTRKCTAKAKTINIPVSQYPGFAQKSEFFPLYTFLLLPPSVLSFLKEISVEQVHLSLV